MKRLYQKKKISRREPQMKNADARKVLNFFLKSIKIHFATKTTFFHSYISFNF